MKIQAMTSEVLAASVIAVPPLARDAQLSVNRPENRKLLQHLEAGGISIVLYGGNAVFYHVSLGEYASLLEGLAEDAAAETFVVPSVGPAYGMMMDQAKILRESAFPTAMVLPQRDIATPAGIAAGVRRFAEAFGKPIVLYIKHDGYLDVSAVRKMVDDGLIAWIKYAVVRDDPAEDPYLRELVTEVDPRCIVSGIGEQPAITHLRDFNLVGFTSGCVCVAPRLSMTMLRAIQAGDDPLAERIRSQFQPLEDLRNGIHPIRVLHHAVDLANIAATGPMLPLLSEIEAGQHEAIRNAADALLQLNGEPSQ